MCYIRTSSLLCDSVSLLPLAENFMLVTSVIFLFGVNQILVTFSYRTTSIHGSSSPTNNTRLIGRHQMCCLLLFESVEPYSNCDYDITLSSNKRYSHLAKCNTSISSVLYKYS